MHVTLARAGMGLVCLMQVAFFLGGLERGAPYLALQVMGLAFALVGALGVTNPARLAVFFGGMSLVRALHVVLELSRLPAWLNLTQAAIFALGCAACVAWAASPARAAARASQARAAMWGVGALYFVAMVLAIDGGRLPGLLGLAAGTVGTFLVAPNLGEIEPPTRYPSM